MGTVELKGSNVDAPYHNDSWERRRQRMLTPIAIAERLQCTFSKIWTVKYLKNEGTVENKVNANFEPILDLTPSSFINDIRICCKCVDSVQYTCNDTY